MLYGAYGYTGRLTAERAVADGDRPLLAGRREDPLRELAEGLDLEWRAFSLDDPARVKSELADVDLVLHCAGPFSATSKPMVDGCLATKTHYLDITGEIPVFEAVKLRDAEAKDAGVVLMPGAGFDVVPSDCLAAALAAQVPEAEELELAFATSGGNLYPGTTKTMIEGLPHGGCVRRAGRLTPVPAAHRTKMVPFSNGTIHCVSIPWGDVSTAFTSTGIPNITVYMGAPRSMVNGMKAMRPFGKILGSPSVQGFLKRQVDRWIEGPDQRTREAARVYLWGAAHDGGRTVEGTLDVCEGYTFTALASLAIVERVLAGEVQPGSVTPSMALGADFVTSIPGTVMRVPR